MRMQAQGLVVNPQWSSPELTHYTVSDLSDSHSKLGYQNQLVAHATQFHRRNTTPANESYLFSGHPPGSRTQPQGQAGIMHGHKSWSCLGHLVTPGRGTVGKDWRAPWDLVHTCSILFNGTTGSAGPVQQENFEEDAPVHRATWGTRLTQSRGAVCLGLKVIMYLSFPFHLKILFLITKKSIPLCSRIFTNYQKKKTS